MTTPSGMVSAPLAALEAGQPLPASLGGAANTSWVPSDNNLLAACDSPGAISNTFTVGKGIQYMIKVPVRVAFTATTAWFILTGSNGSGASTGTFVALLNSTGALMAGSTSADCATQFSALNAQSVTLGTQQPLTAGTFVWVAILSNLASTQPTFRTAGTNTSSIPNLNLSAANYRAASQGSGSTTVIATVTPSSNAATDLIWVGLS